MLIKNFNHDFQKDQSIYDEVKNNMNPSQNKFGSDAEFDYKEWTDNTTSPNNSFNLLSAASSGLCSLQEAISYENFLNLCISESKEESSIKGKQTQKKTQKDKLVKNSNSNSGQNSQIYKNQKNKNKNPNLNNLIKVHQNSFIGFKDRFKKVISQYNTSNPVDSNIQKYVKVYEDTVDKLKIPDHTLVILINSKGWVKVINLSALIVGSEIETFKEVTADPGFHHFLDDVYKNQLYKQDGFFDFQGSMFSSLEYNKDRYQKFQIFLKRKDIISSGKSADNFYYLCKKMFEAKEPAILLDTPIIRNCWQAHPFKSINRINYVEQMEVIVSCSEDRYVKMWSRHGFLHSKLSIVNFNHPNKVWNLPYDWMGVILSELEDVINVVGHMAKQNKRRVDLLALSGPMKKTTNVSKDFEDALHMKKFVDLQYTSLSHIGSTEDLISRLQMLEGTYKDFLASYVYRNFVYKHLLDKYQKSSHYKLNHINVSDVNREKYLIWIRE